MKSFNLIVFSLAVLVGFACSDVSHLRGYDRVNRQRFQRLESNPTPYDAAGYKPNREFNLPGEQPIFAVGNQTPQASEGRFNAANDFDSQSQPQQPQVTYGAPARLKQSSPARQRQPQLQPYRNMPEKLRQQPKPASLQQKKQSQKSAPAKPARLTAATPQQKQQQQLQQLQQPHVFFTTPQLFLNSPQLFQAARLTAVAQPQQLVNTPQQISPTVAASSQPSRLTDNREDADDEDEEDTRPTALNANDAESTDIDTAPEISVKDNKKPEAPTATPTVAYYPAGAFSFVQPISASYVASPTAYQTQYYATTSPLLQQQLTFAGLAAQNQLQAW